MRISDWSSDVCSSDLAIGYDAHVIFLGNVGAFLDQQATNLLALGPSLVRDQLHAQDLGRKLTYFIDGTGQLDAAALATATRVNLGLDHPARSAALFSRRVGLVHRSEERRGGTGCVRTGKFRWSTVK